MKIIKYQGANLTGGDVGSTVSLQGLDWTVTPQGHLVCDVPESLIESANELVGIGYAALETEG